MTRPLTTIFFALTTLMVTAGCATEPEPHWPGRAEVDGPWIAPVRPGALHNPAAESVPEGYAEMIEQIRMMHEEALERRVENRVYDELESVFFTAGVGLELADYYLAAVERQGATSHIRPRLAWYYQQLGLETAARRQAELAVEARPDDPMAHFVLGYLAWAAEDWGPALESFLRAESLDAQFEGPFGLTPHRMVTELDPNHSHDH